MVDENPGQRTDIAKHYGEFYSRTNPENVYPVEDGAFDLVLSCHACYYVSPGESFTDNLREIARVLCPGGRFIFSLAKTNSYILKDAIPLGQGHYRITHDPYGIRNGRPSVRSRPGRRSARSSACTSATSRWACAKMISTELTRRCG